MRNGGYTLHPRIPWSSGIGVLGDDSDPALEHVREAEDVFWNRIVEGVDGMAHIENLVEIAYIENPAAEAKYRAQKEALRASGMEVTESLLFHGTSSKNAEGICKTNFDPAKLKRFAYGKGIYFSRCPNVSLGYGEDLLLCKVLLGKKQPRDPDYRYQLQVRASYCFPRPCGSFFL